MSGPTNKLTDTKIEGRLRDAQKAARTGNGKVILLGDGGGLTLQISKTATASWLHRYMRQGKAAAIGLGSYPDVSLKLARTKSLECRNLLAEGNDPLEEKRATKLASKLEAAKDKTFDECAEEYIKDHKAEWKSDKHLKQWEATLATYCSPIIGKKAIGAITTADVKRILNPIWTEKNETASRIRGRIAAIIDWATAHELRIGSNPARWQGHLEHLLAKSTPESRGDAHHAALPYADLPVFMTTLAQQEGMSRWALELLILTACRTSEVIRATYEEFDLEKRVWTIPKERMKAGKEHRVPLVDRAVAVIEAVRPFSNGNFVFPGGKSDKPLSNMAMAMLLRRMDYKGITVHGFRSTFRDFIGESSPFDKHLAEMALAHTSDISKVEAAYARSDLFQKRVVMMEYWTAYCLNGTVNAA